VRLLPGWPAHNGRDIRAHRSHPGVRFSGSHSSCRSSATTPSSARPDATRRQGSQSGSRHPILAVPPNQTAAQDFSFEYASDGFVYIRSHVSNQYVTVHEPEQVGTTGDAAPLAGEVLGWADGEE